MLKKQPVLLTLLYSLLSLGVYMPVWFLIRFDDFKQLAPSLQIKRSPLIIALVMALLGVALALCDLAGLQKLLSLISFGLLTLESFKLKRMLERVYDIQLDSLLLILFSIWYLQHWINHLVDRPELISQPQ